MKMYSLNEVETIVSGLDHPEAMAWHADGSVWAGGEGGQIYRVDPLTKSFVQKAALDAFCLGLLFLDQERLLICDCKNHRLILWNAKTGIATDFATEVEGEKIKHPNYAVRTTQGEIYVSDSGGWGKEEGKIYGFNAEGSGKIVARGLHFANGLAWSDPLQTLYVAETTKDHVLIFQRKTDGTLERKGVAVKGLHYAVDGLALGDEDLLYVSCYGNSAVHEVHLKSGSSRILLEDPVGVTLNRVTNLLIEKDHTGKTFLWMSNFGAYHLSRIGL